MSDIPAKRSRVPGATTTRPAETPRVAADEAGRWDLSYRPWRSAIVPSVDPPALGVAWTELPVRGVSFLIDVLLIQLVASMFGQVATFLLSNTVFRPNGGITDQVLTAWAEAFFPFIVIGIILATLYVYFYRVFRATPGQMAVGHFTLRDRDGLTLTKRRALVRWLMLYMPAWLVATSQSAAVWLHYDISSSIDQTFALEAFVALPVFWYLLLMLSTGMSKRGRGWHDKAAGSVVVRPAVGA